MGRKREEPIIETVEFCYNGTDKQFNSFLKNVLRDYLSDDKTEPEAEDNEDKSGNQTA